MLKSVRSTKFYCCGIRGIDLSNPGPVFNFESEALKIVDEARSVNLTLRVLGATAFRIHSPNNIRVHDQLARTISDLDFVGYSKDRDKIEKFFTEQKGYTMVPRSFDSWAICRQVYIY